MKSKKKSANDATRIATRTLAVSEISDSVRDTDANAYEPWVNTDLGIATVVDSIEGFLRTKRK